MLDNGGINSTLPQISCTNGWNYEGDIRSIVREVLLHQFYYISLKELGGTWRSTNGGIFVIRSSIWYAATSSVRQYHWHSTTWDPWLASWFSVSCQTGESRAADEISVVDWAFHSLITRSFLPIFWKRFGRRRSYLICLTVDVIAGLATYFAGDYFWFTICRVLQGLTNPAMWQIPTIIGSKCAQKLLLIHIEYTKHSCDFSGHTL